MAEVLATVKNILAEGSKPCIPVVRNALQSLDLLGHACGKTVAKQLPGWLKVKGSNTLLSQEESANILDLKAVFGTSGQPSGRPTTLDTTGTTYERTALGVCQQFTLDVIQRQSCSMRLASPQGWACWEDKLGTGFDRVRSLWLFLDKDDAMLFLVSQLLNQGGLEAAAPVGALNQLPLKYAGRKVIPLQPAERAFCVTASPHRGAFRLSHTAVWKGQYMEDWYDVPTAPQPGTGQSLASVGIRGPTTQYDVDVQRIMNAIKVLPRALAVEVDTRGG
jgi:hypothetical protein